jgi:uncharacterized protein YcfJ
MKYLLILLLIFQLAACSSYRPILDKNEKYLELGEDEAQRQVDLCKKKAQDALDAYKAQRAAKEAGRKAVIGGVVGSAIGAISGRNLRSTVASGLIGAGVGAAIGALAVVGKDKVTPDEMKQRYISKCLADKGYSVIGWV